MRANGRALPKQKRAAPETAGAAEGWKISLVNTKISISILPQTSRKNKRMKGKSDG